MKVPMGKRGGLRSKNEKKGRNHREFSRFEFNRHRIRKFPLKNVPFDRYAVNRNVSDSNFAVWRSPAINGIKIGNIRNFDANYRDRKRIQTYTRTSESYLIKMVRNTKFLVLEAILSMSAAVPASFSENFMNGRRGLRNERNMRGVRGAEIIDPGDGEPDSDRENYFQEIYMLQSAPKQLEFGHVYENPHEWEQRYEKKDFDTNRHQGKVRWADRAGSHGEHYWDYNHSGPSRQKQEESSEEPKMDPPHQQQQQHHRKRELMREKANEEENRGLFRSSAKGGRSDPEGTRRLIPERKPIPSQDVPKNHRRNG